MKFNSLAFRLVVLAAVWSLIVLTVTAFVLRYVYEDSVKKNYKLSLNADLSSLAGSLTSEEKDENGNLKIAKLAAPEYGFVLSGRYWQIQVLDAKEGTKDLYHSDSLLDEKIRDFPSNYNIQPDEFGVFHGQVKGPDNQRLFALETVREVSLGYGEPPQKYQLVVTRSWDVIEADVNEFTLTLSWALFLLGIGIVMAVFVQVNFGLKPLRSISSDLGDIRSGKADRLNGKLPAEIRPLQKELNALIHSNREIVERSRMHVGNLAHALKTPLSVISNEANAREPGFADKVIEQAGIMRDQISHYLDRARMAARVNVIGGVTEIGPALDALARVLQRINEDRNIKITRKYDGSLKFQGEKQDLEEMVGNLLDNACKWASSKVSLSVELLEEEDDDDTAMLKIFIDDDGPGLSKDQMAQAVKRGRRLDESKPGSGLGLSIVADLAHLYKGKFYLEDAPGGGLRAVILLPQAE